MSAAFPPKSHVKQKIHQISSDAQSISPQIAFEKKCDKLLTNGNENKSSSDGPSTRDIRQRLDNKIKEMMGNGKSGVIQSPTSSGKTYTPSTTEWRNYTGFTRNEPVILFSGTTDARDAAVKKSRNSCATYEVLLGRDDSCPLAQGKYDSNNTARDASIQAPDGSEPSEWFATLCDKRGLHISIAHGIFERKHHDTLPCCTDGRCDSIAQWENVPRDSDGNVCYDVIHATHPFLRVPQLVKDCNLVIDEQPDFIVDIGTGRVRKMTSAYLNEVGASINTWEGLVTSLTNRSDKIGQLNNISETPDNSWFLENKDAHALAPGIVEAITTAEQRRHGRWVGSTRYSYPTLNPYHDGPEQVVEINVILEEDDYEVNLLQVKPDLSEAKSVIGLDAHPAMAKWRANVGQSIGKKQIVDAEEHQMWRKNERNLFIIQVGQNKNSWTTGDFNHNKASVICEELRNKYKDWFRTGITAKRFAKDLERHLSEAGANNPETIYFGNEKSVDCFGSERVGLVAGCISPDDKKIKDWMVLLEKEADPGREVVEAWNGGQKWVGPDADVAHSLIRDVRENRVLQACGRYARSPEKSDNGAIVFVLTNVVPDRFVDEEIEDIRPFGKKHQQTIEYVESRDGVKPKEIINNVDVSRKHIYNTLEICRDCSWMQVNEEAGEYNASIYYADRCPNGIAEV